MKEGFELKSKWRKDFFKNDNPIVVEIGCGRGEYTVGLAQKYPNKNFIGVDVKGSRMNQGLHKARELNLENVAFIRAKAENLELLFGENEIDEIWITFPEPQLKYRRRNRRFTSEKFIERYKRYTKNDAVFHLKTDSKLMYDFTLESLTEANHHILFHHDDIYAVDGFDDAKAVKTLYETIFSEKGFSIKYVCFRINYGK
jgi:tRNA (guanine-N7-)-methyltransferase